MNLITEVMNYVKEHDPEVGEALFQEMKRERRNLELIASENIVSPAVMLAMEQFRQINMRKVTRQSVITAVVKKLMYLKIWQLKEQRSFLVQSMHVFSRTAEQMPIWQCIRHFLSREIR